MSGAETRSGKELIMKLIGSYSNPQVRTISVILLEKALPFDIITRSSADGAHERFSALNPLGREPVLITDAGEALFHTPLIAEYLELTQCGPALLPNDATASLWVRHTAALATGVTDCARALVSECRRAADADQQARVLQHRAQIGQGLDRLEQYAAERRWLNSNRLTLADITVGCLLGFINSRRVMSNWCVGRPSLVGLAERLFARQSFACTASPIAANLYSTENN